MFVFIFPYFLFLFIPKKIGGVLGLRERLPSTLPRRSKINCKFIHTLTNINSVLGRSKPRLFCSAGQSRDFFGAASVGQNLGSKKNKFIGQNKFKRDFYPKISVKIKLDRV